MPMGLPVAPLQVYGSDAARASNLRSFVDGKMDVVNTPVGPMLPRNTGGLPNDNDARVFPNNMMFLAGGGCARRTRSCHKRPSSRGFHDASTECTIAGC